MNVFEEAVLGMLCAGNCSLAKIAESLALDAELVAHIAKRELADKGYLDEATLKPTLFGRRSLESGIARSEEKTVGFVFQDPWTGRLWPAFRDRLDYMDIDYSPEGFPDLLLGGSKGRPWRQYAFCLLPPVDNAPPRPAGEDILRAAEAARRAQRRVSSDFYTDEDDIPVELAEQFEAFNRVSFVNQEPEPHFLVTYLYTPHDGSGDSAWYASDPFGTGHNMGFKREVEERVREYTPLAEHVSRCLKAEEDRGGTPLLAHERAESMVRECLKPIPLGGDILAELTEFQVKLLQAEEAQASHRPSRQIVREAFTQARRVMEVLCRNINDRHSDPGVRDILILNHPPRDLNLLRDMIEGLNRKAAEAIGFETAGLRRITRTGARSLRDCADRKARGALASEFMLSVHTATRQQDHPYHRVAAECPGFLRDIERLLDLVHPAAHAGDIETDQLEKLGALTFQVAQLMLSSDNPWEANDG